MGLSLRSFSNFVSRAVSTVRNVSQSTVGRVLAPALSLANSRVGLAVAERIPGIGTAIGAGRSALSLVESFRVGPALGPGAAPFSVSDAGTRSGIASLVRNALPNLGVHPVPPPAMRATTRLPTTIGLGGKEFRMRAGGPLALFGSQGPGSAGLYPSSSIASHGRAYGGLTVYDRANALAFYEQTGAPPRGWHFTRRPGYDPGPIAAIARNRRMNPLNPRALSRALRRAESFAKFARRTVRVTQRLGFKKKRRGRR